MNKITGVYRYLNTSVSNNVESQKRKEFIESSTQIALYYSSKYFKFRNLQESIIEKGDYLIAREFLKNRELYTAQIYIQKLPQRKLKYLWINAVLHSRLFLKIYELQMQIIILLSKIKQYLLHLLKSIPQKFHLILL